MVYVNNRTQGAQAATSGQQGEPNKVVNSANDAAKPVICPAAPVESGPSDVKGSSDKNNNSIPIPNNPDHLVALHLVTTGAQGEDLGTDEKPIAWWTFLVLEVAKNKVSWLNNLCSKINVIRLFLLNF